MKNSFNNVSIKSQRVLFVAVVCIFSFGFLVPFEAAADTAEEIEINVDSSLKLFEAKYGSDEFLKNAAGFLVFPNVMKAGIIVGGEYGEGALRIEGETAGYYSTAAASFGFQLGAQMKSIIIVFLQESTLDDFQASSGWKIGVDASVAIVTLGAGESIDSANIDEPIVAFVFNQEGLMYNLTLEGSKITKIDR